MAKNMYVMSVKAKDRNVFFDLMDAIEGRDCTFEISIIVVEPAPIVSVRKPRQSRFVSRTARKSRVNDAIIATISDQPASIASMKASLIEAGMSSNSLSTGLADLQKAGVIKRVGDGMYALKEQAEAAAE